MKGVDAKGDPLGVDPRPAESRGFGPRRLAMARETFPKNLTPTDLYDRIAHNLYSINLVWTLVTGLLGHVHAGRFCLRRNRALPGEERFAHVRDEFDDLSARLLRVLGLWFRDRLGQLVQRAGSAGLVSLRWAPAWPC